MTLSTQLRNSIEAILHRLEIEGQLQLLSIPSEFTGRNDGEIVDIVEKILSDHGVIVHRSSLDKLEVLRGRDNFNCVIKRNGELWELVGKSQANGMMVVQDFISLRQEQVPIEELRTKSNTEVIVLSVRGVLHSFLSNTHEHHASSEHDNAHEHHLKASELLARLWGLIKHEKRDIAVVVIYSIIIGALSLVVPLASQSLVNAVSLGVYSTQLIVLCAGVGFGLVVLGIFQVMELTVVDTLRRRIFIRTAFDVAFTLPRLTTRALDGEYAPELVNRFFDVTTITKSLSKFLLDGVSAALVALMGLILLGIYHPFFLLFDVFLIAFIVVLVLLLGRGGLRTSIAESKKKYEVAHWLEEIARCLPAFKLHADPRFSYEHLDSIAAQYVNAHRKHFAVIARQVAGSSFFRSVATVGVLGIGGILVIERQLSLGQLVAAELVIIALLSSLEKLITQFEDFYDLLTGIDKLAAITDRERERSNSLLPIERTDSIDLQLHSCSFSYPNGDKVLRNVSMHVAPGSRLSIIGENGSGKTTLAELLAGLHEADAGTIEVNGLDIRHNTLLSLRRAIAIFSRDNHVFSGTVEQNICMGRDISLKQLMWAVDVAGLRDDLRGLDHGLHSRVVSEGSNLSHSLMRRIMLARCIVGQPGLLILDEGFDGIEPSIKQHIVDRLYSDKRWSIIDISHDEDLLKRADTIYALSEGQIVEEDQLRVLASRPQSMLHRLFPKLVQDLVEKKA